MTPVNFRLESADARFTLIVLQGWLERCCDADPDDPEDRPLSFLDDPDGVRQYERIRNAFNAMVSQYTEHHDDLPPMMMEGDKAVRHWPTAEELRKQRDAR